MVKRLLFLCALAALCLPRSAAAASQEQAQYASIPRLSSQAAMHAWLQQLAPAGRRKAQAVIDEYAPRIADLREHIARKKSELALLRYDRFTSPDTLPRLGFELQQLRDELRSLLIRADQRMFTEVGVSLGSPQSRGCSMVLYPAVPE